jgi:hypothetical protein
MEQSEQDFKRAKRNASRKFGFFIHATVFVLVNLMLFAINLWLGTSRLWAAFPFFGWGIGLLIHGLVVFGPFGRIYQSLLERELARGSKPPANRPRT